MQLNALFACIQPVLLVAQGRTPLLSTLAHVIAQFVALFRPISARCTASELGGDVAAGSYVLVACSETL